MFRTIGIQVGYVTNVQDAIAEAADLKVPLGERLDVFDFQTTIYREQHVRKSVHICVPAPLASILCQQNRVYPNLRPSKLTVSRRHVCYGDATNLRVTEAKQECSIGLVFENQV